MSKITCFTIPVTTLQQSAYAAELSDSTCQPSLEAQTWFQSQLEKHLDHKAKSRLILVAQDGQGLHNSALRFGEWPQLQRYVSRVHWDYSQLGLTVHDWRNLQRFHFESFLSAAQHAAQDQHLQRFAIQFKKNGKVYTDIRIVPESSLDPAHHHIVIERQAHGAFSVASYSGEHARVLLAKLEFVGIPDLKIPKELNVFYGAEQPKANGDVSVPKPSAPVPSSSATVAHQKNPQTENQKPTKTNWTPARWKNLDKEQLQNFLNEARLQANDQGLNEFIIQFKVNGASYDDVKAVPIGQENKNRAYGKLFIRLSEGKFFAITTKSGGNGGVDLAKYLEANTTVILSSKLMRKTPERQNAWLMENWRKVNKTQLKAWLKEARTKANDSNVNEFVLSVKIHDEVHTIQVTADSHRVTAKLHFRLLPDGNFELWKVSGSGAAGIAQTLRDSRINGLTVAAEVRKARQHQLGGTWNAAKWKRLQKDQLKVWLKEARKIAANPQLDLFCVKFLKQGSAYYGVTALPLTEVKSDGAGYLVIRYVKETGTFEIHPSKGTGGAELVKLLSEAGLDFLHFQEAALAVKPLRPAWEREAWKKVDDKQHRLWLEEVRKLAKDPTLTRFAVQFEPRRGKYDSVAAVPENKVRAGAGSVVIEVLPGEAAALRGFSGKGSSEVADILVHESTEKLQADESMRKLIAAKQVDAARKSMVRRQSFKGFVDLELLTLPITAPGKLAMRAIISETTGPVLGNLCAEYIVDNFFGDGENFDPAKSAAMMGYHAAVRGVMLPALNSAVASRPLSVQRFVKNNVPFLLSEVMLDLARGEFHPLEYAQQVPMMAVGSAAADLGVMALTEAFGKRVMGFAARYIHPLISFTLLHGIGKVREQWEKEEQLSAAALQISATQSLRYPQLRATASQSEALWNYVTERLNFSKAGEAYQTLQRKIVQLSQSPLEYLGEPILQLPYLTESDRDLLMARANLLGKVEQVHEGFRKGLEERVQRLQKEIDHVVHIAEKSEFSEGRMTALLMRQQLEEQLGAYQRKAVIHLAKQEGLQDEECAMLEKLLALNQRLQQQQRTREMVALLVQKEAALTVAERDELQHMRFDCSHEHSWNEYCQIQAYTDESAEQWQQNMHTDVAGVDRAFNGDRGVQAPEHIPLEDFSRFHGQPLDFALLAFQARGVALFPEPSPALQKNQSEQELMAFEDQP